MSAAPSRRAADARPARVRPVSAAAPPDARRTPRARLLARSAGLLAVLAPLVGVTPSPAAAAPATDELPVAVDVTAVTPQVLAPGQDLRVTVTVRNDGDTELANPSAVLRLSRTRPGTSAELDAWVDAEARASAGSAVGRPAPLGAPLAPGASAEVAFDVPAASVGLLDTPDAWGPRGLAVELVDGRRRVGIERTFLLWLPDSEDLPHTRLSVLVPLVASAPGGGTASATSAQVPAPTATEGGEEAATDEPTPEPTEEPAPDEPVQPEDTALEAQTGPEGRLRALLTASGASTGVSWALDPALVARASDAGPQSAAWLEELRTTAEGRDVLALPWADPDLAALAHADRPDLLTAALASSSAARPLVSEGVTPVQWAADDVPDLRTAALAAGTDVPSLVVGPGALTPERTTSTTAGPVTTVTTDAGPVAALVPDPTLSALLTDPARLQPGATAATLAQRLLAETAVVAHEERETVPHVLATVPRDWTPDTALVTAALDALDAAPWVRLAPASDLLDAAPDTSDREPLPDVSRAPGELSAATVNALGDARNAAVAFAAVLEDPDAHLEGLDREVLRPLSVAWRADDEGRRDVVRTALADATARRSGLSVVLSDRFRMISSTSQIHLALRSTLDQRATVRIEMRPRKACLEVGDAPTATVEPGAEQTVVVEVSASANCDVLVDVFALAPDGTSVATAGRFDAHVSPTIENVGTAVVGALLALALLVGIVKTVRRGQTARRGARLAAQAVPGDESETTPA
ncbi:DUF6049 family protein [Cellulomonas cellasea]|uniref:Uncharacterized protein n=2 Tax=Cellulomonas cellasea TaxID=43670 RepID=A0A0A0BCY0_9CELL|nr:DUF6049 family protein [Cellulomonas cellasea]KGM03917.1 hypothetical protein Q760_07945 [Cellulomonas cellasea DSM 20118]GEA87307.1 hypothetical protein CCE01nite_12560 [Cellulomonas cellasea]